MEILNFKIGGMSCASCAATIEKEVRKIEGVESSSVNYAVESGNFEINSSNLKDKIKKKIVSLGYTATEKQETQVVKSDDNFHKFIISISLALAIFSLAMWPFQNVFTQKVNWSILLVLCLPIWAWVGLKFQRSLVGFLKTARSNMNTLIGLGTSSAFLYSVFITLFPETSIELGLTMKVYFEAVGFIISFVYLGQFFEEKAKRKTTEAMNSLFKLSSKNATILKDGDMIEIPIENVSIHNILRVRPGEKFPVDGIITKGSSAIDEAMISGEPIPIVKSENDLVFAGTVNGDSVIDYKATKVGADTFLSQIITFVEQAQGSKPEIQKYADKISSYFTPAVIVAALLTFIVWFYFGPEPIWGNAISNLIAVLVIACPCALGLATPTAVVVSTGRASLKGLLIGGGEVIEKAVDVDTIIFDKTGTITEGKPSVIECLINDKEVLREVAGIEQFSEHPLSKAIVKYALEAGHELNEPDSFEVIKGKGLKAEINGNDYIIGNEKLLIENEILLSEALISKTIGSIVYVAKNNIHIGTIMIGDKIKASSKETIQGFKEKGIATWMITGDNEIVAKSVADELGIEHFVANALPLEKSDYVEKLQKEGRIVAMVGDGVNDAPALAKANLSLAMGTGTDVAINASDVTIVKGDLSKALDFLNLSKGTMKIIKQNLFLSVIYNVLLIPVAAGVLVLFGGPMMPPVLASVAMGMSSISVVSNSLRIRKLI